MARRRAVPTWFVVVASVWLLVYLPLVVLLGRRYDVHWFVIFFAIVLPLWGAVRVWVHRVSRRRRESSRQGP